MTVLIVDYGMGNLYSVSRALENLGAAVQISSDPSDIANVDRIILPGVGSFGSAMARLRERGWIDPIIRAVTDDRLPFLGICLGMQLLAERGREGADTEGLGLIRGCVVRLQPRVATERVPHVGWNNVRLRCDNPLFSGIAQESDFYFVHSYCMELEDNADCLADTDYCGGFAAAVHRENVFGVQFHPEKSAVTGELILKNFIQL